MRELLIYPLTGLRLQTDIGSEFRVNRVTFISKEKLLRLKSRFGITAKTRTQIKANLDLYHNDLIGPDAYALLQIKGGSSNADHGFKLVEREAAILAVSQLTYSSRSHNGVIALGVRNSSKLDLRLVVNLDEDIVSHKSQPVGPSGKLTLSDQWKKSAKGRGFFSLLKIIRGEIDLNSSWLYDIRNASVLIGKSQQSREMSTAFLYNMMALETLLLSGEGKHKENLISRIQAFIGWSSMWDSDGYEQKIERLYETRNSLVHDGKIESVGMDNLLESDNLIFNVLYNVVVHIDRFKKKEDLIQFANLVGAERKLKIKSKHTPKTASVWESTSSDTAQLKKKFSV